MSLVVVERREVAMPESEEPGRGVGPRVPRWVVVFGIVVLVLIALTVTVVVVSGGEHGPGRHASSAPAASVGTG